MSLIFRKHKPTDLPAIRDIHRQNHKDQGGTLLRTLYEQGHFFVVERDGVILAYVQMRETLPDRVLNTRCFSPVSPDGVYIRQVAVAKGCQDQGVGSFLYRELCREYAGRSIYAHVHALNEASAFFHLKNEFQPIGLFVAENYLGHWRYLAFLFEHRAAESGNRE